MYFQFPFWSLDSYDESPNTDGFNVQGRDIVVEHSSVRNGDDCVPIFSPSRNVTVRHMYCSCGNGVAVMVWPPLSYSGGGGDIVGVTVDNITFDGRGRSGCWLLDIPGLAGAPPQPSPRPIF